MCSRPGARHLRIWALHIARPLLLDRPAGKPLMHHGHPPPHLSLPPFPKKLQGVIGVVWGTCHAIPMLGSLALCQPPLALQSTWGMLQHRRGRTSNCGTAFVGQCSFWTGAPQVQVAASLFFLFLNLCRSPCFRQAFPTQRLGQLSSSGLTMLSVLQASSGKFFVVVSAMLLLPCGD